MKRSTYYFPLLAAGALLAIPLRLPAVDTQATPAPTPELSLARQLNEAFVHVAESVSPCVVVITVTQKPNASHAVDGNDDSEDPWEQFRKFFRQHDGGQQDQPQEPSIGQGSGIIIRKDGYILTNRHVVEDAEEIKVRLKDGRIFTAEVRGVDAPADVAVIKINATDLPVAKLADSSKTRVGEFAIAIGAPFSLEYSVTFGHVSAKDRSGIVPMGEDNNAAMMDQSFIQTDANINPGNSGGPLVNIDGEVIGINTLIRGLHTGIGFAIPSNLAREVADKLITDGKFTRSWLGIGIESLREDPELSGLYKGVQDGVVVTEILPNGPAAKSSLTAGDVITAIDGKNIVTAQQLKDEIRTKAVGKSVTLQVYRWTSGGGQSMKVNVKPGELIEKSEEISTDNGNSNEHSPVDNSLGFTIHKLNAEQARRFNVDMAEGVIVTSVDKDGLAAHSGILEGDIITGIDDHPIKNPTQFHDAIKSVDPKKGAIIHLISDGHVTFKVLKNKVD